MTSKKIGIIGLGNMGQAIYKSLLEIFDANNIYICDHHANKLKDLKVCSTAADLVNKVDIVILAVKPQSFAELASQINVDFKDKIVISVMVGIKIQTLQKKLGATKIVRSIPNIAAKYDLSSTIWFAANLTSQEKELIKKIFSAMGFELELNKEESINDICPINGCGPAYFYYFAEIMVEYGETFGLPKSQMEQLVKSTLIGTAKLLEKDSRSFAELRKAVTSKGGVTEASIKKMQEDNFTEIVNNALLQARKRGKELSK